MESKNQILFAELKFNPTLEKWICSCGAAYSNTKPKPSYCMKCGREWLDGINKSNAQD